MINKLKLKIKQLYFRVTGKFDHLSKTIQCKKEWYGNIYGGFFVNPELLDKNSIVYSFGIGEDISFDEAIIKKHGCDIYAFDPTPKSINWIKKQQLPATFKFFNYGISTKSGFLEFYLPKNPHFVSGSTISHTNVDSKNKVMVLMKSFIDIVNELEHNRIDLLKLDIEGLEYEVLENILNSKIDITQIAVEFHERFFSDGKNKTKKILQILKRSDFEIFAISNSFEEISFIKNKALKN